MASEEIIPEGVVARMIETMRNRTQLSHSMSKVAVMVMVNVLKEDVPSLANVWNKMEIQIKTYENTEPPEVCEDVKKLNHIFHQLWSCKTDEQQRSWPIHEDELIILQHLENLHCILVEADPRICREAIFRSDFEALDLLSTYYQMEPRRFLRLSMLKVFLACCELDVEVINHLLTCVLPLELARGLPLMTDDFDMFQNAALVLTAIFSTSHQPPQTIYDQFNFSFLQKLLDWIEEDEDLSDEALSILLSFNLHMKHDSEHSLVEIFSSRSEAKIFTEKLIFLVNREDDPSKVFPHPEVLATPNSVLKLLIDLFSSPRTDQLFYQNDVKVLIDIVVRQLSDLSPGHPNRVLYLRLAFNIISSSSYTEHVHQLASIQRLFVSFQMQEDTTEEEKQVLQEYSNQFPEYFTNTSF